MYIFIKHLHIYIYIINYIYAIIYYPYVCLLRVYIVKSPPSKSRTARAVVCHSGTTSIYTSEISTYHCTTALMPYRAPALMPHRAPALMPHRTPALVPIVA